MKRKQRKKTYLHDHIDSFFFKEEKYQYYKCIKIERKKTHASP
jgi:hypothetical protein